MIRSVTDEKEINYILEILNPYREKCLYLFCNITKLGGYNQNFKIFFEDEDNTVIGQYYGDSVHILAPEKINDTIYSFILKTRPRTIFSSRRIELDQRYDEEITSVYKLTKKVEAAYCEQTLKQLKQKDIESLTSFLYTYSSEYQKTYDKEKLQNQLFDRLESGYCRYFGVYSNDQLIACAFTKAEISDLMIVGGILVSPEYRGNGLGKALCGHKAMIAVKENKDAYCFIDENNKVSVSLHIGCGYENVATVYKYTSKQ